MGFAELSRRCQTETTMRQPIGQRKQHKGARNLLCAPLVDSPKLFRTPQFKIFRNAAASLAQPRRKTLNSAQRQRACDPYLAFLSGRAALHVSSCAAGIHVFSRGADCSADRFSAASFRLLRNLKS